MERKLAPSSMNKASHLEAASRVEKVVWVNQAGQTSVEVRSRHFSCCAEVMKMGNTRVMAAAAATKVYNTSSGKRPQRVQTRQVSTLVIPTDCGGWLSSLLLRLSSPRWAQARGAGRDSKQTVGSGAGASGDVPPQPEAKQSDRAPWRKVVSGDLHFTPWAASHKDRFLAE